MPPIAIRCKNLHKSYDHKVEAVCGLDLEIVEGECFGLLGPNGAGKTTTIEIIEGLLEPTSGEVELFGKRWGEKNHGLREDLGISLQETKLPDRLTVAEVLSLFRSFYRCGQEPESVLQEVELVEKRDTWVNKLSGGQRQRLAVACALVGNPRILFLDEPTTGLDPQSRRQLWQIIQDFQRKGGTILLTTHYMDEAERLCGRVGIVDHGKLIALGSPRELIASLGGEHIVEFALENEADHQITPELLKQLDSVQLVHQEQNSFSMQVQEPHLAIPSLIHLLRQQQVPLARLATRHASLEDVFVKLTGRHLRED
ncbi:MAG: ABC transporter ATP-binding protein [Terriglobia bacterium]